MKIRFLLLSMFCITIVFTTCKKESPQNSDENDPTTIFSSTFDSHADLLLWSQSSTGEAVIDQETLKLVAKTGCFQFETIDLLPVVSGKTYQLKFWGKVTPAETGDPAYCAGNFTIYIVQGNDNIIAQSFGNYKDWVQKGYSFQATSSASIKIKFLVGTIRGAWINDLELTEK